MTAPPKRRWFYFSLRTMFVLVMVLTIPLGWLAWQFSFVRERNKMRLRIIDAGGDAWTNFGDRAPRIPLLRLLLFKDKDTQFIAVPDKILILERERISQLFPESEILSTSSPKATKARQLHLICR